jgi:hypothetical protein
MAWSRVEAAAPISSRCKNFHDFSALREGREAARDLLYPLCGGRASTRIHGIAALALLPALAAVACANWRGIEEPQVRVICVDLDETGTFEQKLDVGLRIYNPNDFPLEVHGIHFDLALEGERVARAKTTRASPFLRRASARSM